VNEVDIFLARKRRDDARVEVALILVSGFVALMVWGLVRLLS
jgi:hypothetical protein